MLPCRKQPFAGRGGMGMTEMIGMHKTLWLLAVRLIGHLAGGLALAVTLAASAQPGFAQRAREFHRTLPVTASDPVTLDVQMSEGELQIAYGRQDQVVIAVMPQLPAGAKEEKEF